MKILKYIFSAVFLLSLLTACDEDLLEKYPLDQISSADFLKTASDQQIYLNQFYPV